MGIMASGQSVSKDNAIYRMRVDGKGDENDLAKDKDYSFVIAAITVKSNVAR